MHVVQKRMSDVSKATKIRCVYCMALVFDVCCMALVFVGFERLMNE